MWFLSLFGLSVLLFSWWAYKRLKRKRKDVPVVNKELLHGHDLEKWHYLGWVELKFNETEYPVFLFLNKDDYSKRSYTITGGYDPSLVEKYHSYVTKYLEPWSKGEYELYTLCRNPSRWLNEFMLDKFGCEWDKETQWWKNTDKAKYQSAQKKQTTTRKKTETVSEEDNVVKVEFGKKDES